MSRKTSKYSFWLLFKSKIFSDRLYKRQLFFHSFRSFPIFKIKETTVPTVKASFDGEEPTQEEYRVGSLYVCPARHIVRAGDQEVHLALKEFELLCMLLRSAGVVLTRDVLLGQIWGYSFDGESRTVDVHIRNLRKKLGEAGNCIETVKGVGYKIGGI